MYQACARTEPTEPMTSSSGIAHRLTWALTVAATLMLLWLVLTGGKGLPYGLTAALLAAAISAWVAPGMVFTPRPLGLLRFVGLFLYNSLVGGADVGWRAMHPAMPMQPRWIDYQLRLQHPASRTLFLLTVNLTPGTLAANLHGDTVRVHAITADTAGELARVEAAIGALFVESNGGEVS